VLEDPRADYEMFNVGGDQAVTVSQFAAAVAAVFGRTDYEPRASGKYRFGDTRHIYSDVSKLKALGWRPRRGVHESVEAYKTWLGEADAVADILDYCEREMAKLGVVRSVAS
jgi:dTDP-L-rhamnose 4-epimerase